MSKVFKASRVRDFSSIGIVVMLGLGFLYLMIPVIPFLAKQMAVLVMYLVAAAVGFISLPVNPSLGDFLRSRIDQPELSTLIDSIEALPHSIAVMIALTALFGIFLAAVVPYREKRSALRRLHCLLSEVATSKGASSPDSFLIQGAKESEGHWVTVVRPGAFVVKRKHANPFASEVVEARVSRTTFSSNAGAPLSAMEYFYSRITKA